MSTIILVHSFWEIDEKFSLLILASFSHHYHLLLPFLPKENFSRIFNTTDTVCLPVLYIYMYMCVHMCMYVLHVLCIFIHMYIYICTLYVKWVRFFVLFCFVLFFSPPRTNFQLPGGTSPVENTWFSPTFVN
jgi:hypothetical protein